MALDPEAMPNLAAPIKGNIQVRPGQMAQAVQQAHEITAPLAEVALKLAGDIRAVADILDNMDVHSPVRTIRPETGPENGGLSASLLACTNEIATLRMMAEALSARIGYL